MITAAIGGLGYLGQSIRESMEALTGEVSGETAARKEQINVLSADDAAAKAYQDALNAGNTPEQANKAAAWAAYTTAYETTFGQEMLNELVRLSNDEEWDAYYTLLDALAVPAFSASEAAYKSAWETFNAKESSIEELIRDRAYSGMLDVATTILTVLSESQNVTLDVSVIATDFANEFAEDAYDTYFEVADCSDPSREMASRLACYMYEPLVSAAQNAGLTWRNDTPYDPVAYMASDVAAAIFGSDYATAAAGHSLERRLELARWADRVRSGEPDSEDNVEEPSLVEISKTVSKRAFAQQ